MHVVEIGDRHLAPGALRAHIKWFDTEIEATSAKHTDAEIYTSLPEANPNFGAHLAATGSPLIHRIKAQEKAA